MRTTVQRCLVHWEAAHTAVEAAVCTAEELGIQIAAAVADSSGNLVAFLGMPGAFLHSSDIAMDKAYTAAGFRQPTSAWSTLLEAHSLAVRDGLLRRPRMVAFGGGLPMRVGGEMLGGIGVSGGSEEQDESCARAGLHAIGAEEYTHGS